MELVKNSRIGIWGLGKTGWAAVRHFKNNGFFVWGMDRDSLQEKKEDIEIIQETETNSVFFCKESDYIFASPGVEIKGHYAKYSKKWINECDYFQFHYQKPIIAITGSVGKTSTLHLLSGILDYYKISHVTGGNIGTPLFDILDFNQDAPLALIELSSFQLETATQFAPDIAIVTNIYPNHLDRHKTFDEYSRAKWRITAAQNSNQHLIIPQELGNYPLWICSAATKHVIDHAHEQNQEFSISFSQNWSVIKQVLSLLQLPVTSLHVAAKKLTLPEHRFEYVGNYAGISFYNDSKSTLTESTLAAVRQFSPQKPIVFLGGESKGVDRSPLIQALKEHVKYVICFGKEARILNQLCTLFSVSSSEHATLFDAFHYGITIAKSGDIILFSPSGSSYDLFKNYIERGNCFKELVHQLMQKKIS